MHSYVSSCTYAQRGSQLAMLKQLIQALALVSHSGGGGGGCPASPSFLIVSF